VAAPFADASDWQEVIASVSAVLLGLGGMYVAYELYSARSVRAPRPLVLLERKFYWDELYHVVFYKPADLIARGLGRFVEQPLIAGSIGEVTRGFRLGSGELSRMQNGLVRSYALALASGIAVLAVVFLSTR
jgi:NADH-quinone oxidoreductase subunit L